jgi:tetratricopeptide (TPR) repeat protein
LSDGLLAQAGQLLAQGHAALAAKLIADARITNSQSARLAFAEGVIARERGDLVLAITCLREAMALDPTAADPYLPFAQSLAAPGRINLLTRWGRLSPHDPQPLIRLSHSWREMGKSALAISAAQEAILRQPQAADGHMALGVAQHATGDLAQACDSLCAALALAPDHFSATINLALALFEFRGPKTALYAVERALALNPNSGDAAWTKGMYLLALGDFEPGWRWYEGRLNRPGIMRSEIANRPIWRGEDFAGQTLLLWAEQGQGDSLQFIRFYDQIKARGGRVIVEVQPSLKALFEGQQRFDRVIARGEATGAFDLHLPMMSAAHIFKVQPETLAQSPYLRITYSSGIDLTSLAQRHARKIGLVWAGNPGNATIDRVRSMELAALAPLLDLTDTVFFSLQLGGHDQLPGGVIDLAPQLVNFAATADVLGQLDLVISVDTSVVHLAGALGLPCFVLLPAASDWRWQQARPDSPLYPSLKLFRQDRLGDWSGPIARIKEILSLPHAR